MKKNVIILHSLYFPSIIGGAEISTKILAETLAQEYKVFVITVGSNKKIVTETIEGVKIYRLPPNNLYWLGENKQKPFIYKIIWHMNDIFNFKQYKLVKKLFKDINPSLIHTQNLPGLSFSVWKAAENLNIPVIHTLRDYSLLEPVKSKTFSGFYKKFSKQFSKSVTAVTGISKFILDGHINEGLFPNAATFVIPNVVEDQLQAIEKQIRDRPLHVAYFGQLAENKGVNYLIEAIKTLPGDIVSELKVYGDGPLQKELISLAGDDSRIKFNGKIKKDEISKAMAESDIVVVPSTWEEPFGRVIIEAYQAGTPVLASKVGGIPEVINNKEFLFKPFSAAEIKNSIYSYRYLSLREKKLLSEECKQHSQLFNTDNLLRTHANIYENHIKSEG